MSWTKLPVGLDAGGVLATTTKKELRLSFARVAARHLAGEDELYNVSAAVGDGEDAGQLRFTPDDDGVTLEEVADDRYAIVLPLSVLPELQACRASPLVWAVAEDGSIVIRLPVAAAKRPVGRRPLQVVPSGKDEPTIDLISVPDLYKQLHAEAWRKGIEIAFLSDGNAVVGGKVMTIEEMEESVTRRLKASAA